MQKKLTAIDLFSGCGGLSEGFMQTGMFDFVAHVEWETPMVNTLRKNLVSRWGYKEQQAKDRVIQFDIQKTKELLSGEWSEETISKYGKNNSEIVSKKGIDGLVDGKKVDIIIGGPPCQAYSIAGRAQDPNSMKDDYRNYLFESFIKVVKHYKPLMFVFENVPGILSAMPGDELVINRIHNAFKEIGYEVRTKEKMRKAIFTSADFEVPQERRRVIIFGVKIGGKIKLEDLYDNFISKKTDGKKKTVHDAIGNLPKFAPLEETVRKGNKNISHRLVGSKVVNLHECRYNNKRDIQVFRTWLKNSMNKCSHEEKVAFYKSVTGCDTRHNKYRSLEWDKPSPTIVAHLHKDGLMFIHPDINQARTITIREAALLQSFPIDYEFVGSTAYCFKMIGNAVPVLFAKKIAESIIETLEVKK